MLKIEPGVYMMGEYNSTPAYLKGPLYTDNGDWDERPVHMVRITYPFFISETPVTIEQYRQFKKEYSGLKLFSPYVAGISWDDAMAFCRWLSKKEASEYRLPTEGEWEYAARAGTTSIFWSGRESPKVDAPNPWGLKDIAFGVPEWCYDWYGKYPEEDQIDPIGPERGFTRVVRDGGIEMRELDSKDDKTGKLGFIDSKFKNIAPFYRRSANRAGMLPDVPSPENTSQATQYTHYIGFRVVQAALPATKPLVVEKPFVLNCILQSNVGEAQSLDMKKPYFNARPLFPIPPDNDQGVGIEMAGIHPAVMAHIQSSGIAVTPNGDLLVISFSSKTPKTESEANTTMIVSRFRYGSQQWDMPELFLDIADGQKEILLSLRNIPKKEYSVLFNINGYNLALCRDVVILDSAFDQLLTILG